MCVWLMQAASVNKRVREAVISGAAVFVSGAEGCCRSSEPVVSGGWPLWLRSQQTLSMSLPLTAPSGSISPTVGGRVQSWLEGEGRPVCCVKAPLFLSFSFFLYSSSPTPTPSPFHLTHGSFRSHHLTTPSSPTCNHLLPHDKHAHAAITPQENALAS